MTLVCLASEIGTYAPAATARGAIVEKGEQRRKAIGDYLNNWAPGRAKPAKQACSRLQHLGRTAIASKLAPA